ncbi:hypothetical protein IU405_01070 [Polaribacter sp. BAL334]|uniref:hypothetical protein n=1 Tax=Polaribacter sp. BAL334 TaxID=1708178 RepID=UPI0018D24D4C|nr:hypothetical protein [Polaribacter sp. BAL334]MBG7610836.1 hypothetical protein [Polaribacter sp. BAL334]
MTAFHYKAFKLSEDESFVKYNLNTDFFLDPNDFIEVIIRKKDLKILNYDKIKDLLDLQVSKKPLNWLRAKCTDDRIVFKENLKHLA